VRVVRQVRGVDSNKLQPIIRYHSDKDFRAPVSEVESPNYKELLFSKKKSDKLTSRQRKMQNVNTPKQLLKEIELDQDSQTLNGQDDEELEEETKSRRGYLKTV